MSQSATAAPPGLPPISLNRHIASPPPLATSQASPGAQIPSPQNGATPLDELLELEVVPDDELLELDVVPDEELELLELEDEELLELELPALHTSLVAQESAESGSHQIVQDPEAAVRCKKQL